MCVLYIYMCIDSFCYMLRYYIVVITDVENRKQNVSDECASPYCDADGIS